MKLGESYIRAVTLMGFEELCQANGCDLRAVMRELDIPESALQNVDELISFRGNVALLETISQRHALPNLGLMISRHISPDFTSLGPSVFMASFVSTVREWQETAIHYWSFHTNGFALQLLKPEHSNSAILRVHFNGLSLPARQFTEACVANIVGVARAITDDFDTLPIAVRFQHQKPADTSEHESYFRCPVEFGQDHVEIEFGANVLDKPTSGRAKIFKPLVRLYISERIRRMHLYDHSTSATVALSITSLLGSGGCNLETVAEALNTNAKALQRQLTKENKIFSELLEEVRANMARHLLVETDAPVAHVAGLLDYSTTAPFTTAFGRWTGTTPLRYRQQERRKRKNAAPGKSMAVDG